MQVLPSGREGQGLHAAAGATSVHAEVFTEVVWPVAVCCLGVGVSVLALGPLVRDLFAREIIGGMLDIEPDVIKRQGRWSRGDKRLDSFRARWRKFDWTRVLTDG